MFLRSVHGAWAAAKSCANELMRVSSSSSAWTTTASNVAGSLGLPYSCRPWWDATRCVIRHSSSLGNPGILEAFSRISWQVSTRCPTSFPSSVYSKPGSGEISRLADVVEQAPGGDQVAIELGVMVADAPAELHDGERVLAEAARVGVMDALGRGRPQEGRGQLAVVEEREEKRPHVGVAHLGREYADVLEHRLYGHAVDVSHGPDARRSVGRPDAGG